MGYNTDFAGHFDVTPRLSEEHIGFLREFAEDCRSEGPGGYCQWVPSKDGSRIEWDGNEKFYNYVEWMRHLLSAYLVPWGHTVNGMVEWIGDERGDMGLIEVRDNKMTVRSGRVVYDNCND